jgi:hypothetical protein
MPDASILFVGLLLFLLVWTTWTLTRLRRLEGRLDRAWNALDTQLQRRADLVEELAGYYPGAVGEERAARLAAAAAEARTPLAGDREQAENALGRHLRELPDDLPGLPASLKTDLDGTSIRLALARRFFNDAVRDTRSLREARLSRVLHLHGSQPLPRYFDIDDRLDVAVGVRQSGS